MQFECMKGYVHGLHENGFMLLESPQPQRTTDNRQFDGVTSSSSSRAALGPVLQVSCSAGQSEVRACNTGTLSVYPYPTSEETCSGQSRWVILTVPIGCQPYACLSTMQYRLSKLARAPCTLHKMYYTQQPILQSYASV